MSCIEYQYKPFCHYLFLQAFLLSYEKGILEDKNNFTHQKFDRSQLWTFLHELKVGLLYIDKFVRHIKVVASMRRVMERVICRFVVLHLLLWGFPHCAFNGAESIRLSLNFQECIFKSACLLWGWKKAAGLSDLLCHPINSMRLWSFVGIRVWHFIITHNNKYAKQGSYKLEFILTILIKILWNVLTEFARHTRRCRLYKGRCLKNMLRAMSSTTLNDVSPNQRTLICVILYVLRLPYKTIGYRSTLLLLNRPPQEIQQPQAHKATIYTP